MTFFTSTVNLAVLSHSVLTRSLFIATWATEQRVIALPIYQWTCVKYATKTHIMSKPRRLRPLTMFVFKS